MKKTSIHLKTLQKIVLFPMIVLLLIPSIAQGQVSSDTLSSCDSIKIDYVECVNFALEVEKRSKQQDTLIKAQKSLISKKNTLLKQKAKELKLMKRKKNRQRVQLGLIGLVLGLFFGLAN